MTPAQRAAALRLADALDADCMVVGYDEVSALLRELAAEPVQEPSCDAWPAKPLKQVQVNVNGVSMMAEPERAYFSAFAMQANENAIRSTHPPEQRKPLTDEEALAIIKSTPQEGVTQEGWIRRQRLSWVRAIERAHGITGEQE